MQLDLLKGILLFVMFLVTLGSGLVPIKVLQILTKATGRAERRASFTISLMSCFAGGVFLAVCFLDLLPEAYESFNEWKALANFHSDYPYVPLLFIVGFFGVKLLEEAVGMYCGYEEHQEVRRKHTATYNSYEASNVNDSDENIHRKVVKTVTFILALMFHSGLEGLAFGVQETSLSVTTLFFGIIVHKAVVAFSAGMKLVDAHPNRRWLVVALVVAFALSSPLCGAAGVILEDSAMVGQTKLFVTSVLLSLSLGTFLYITFFEILVPENDKSYSKFAQWIASVIGFTIIAAMTTFEAE